MIKNFTQFNEASLLYKQKYQDKIECPSCNSKNAEFLGPSDYVRDEKGDYDRVMGYKCKDCKQVYGVLKK